MSAFVDLGSLAQLRVWDGVHGRTIEGEQLTFALVELEPHALVPAHSHPNEQVGVLLRGQMDWTIGGEHRLLEKPGEGWRILGGVEHEVRAGPEGAVVIEAFAPPRHDWAGLEPSGRASTFP